MDIQDFEKLTRRLAPRRDPALVRPAEVVDAVLAELSPQFSRL